MAGVLGQSDVAALLEPESILEDVKDMLDSSARAPWPSPGLARLLWRALSRALFWHLKKVDLGGKPGPFVGMFSIRSKSCKS